MSISPYPSKPLPFFLHYMRYYKKYVAAIMLMLIVSSILAKLSPYFFSKIIDILTEYQGDKTQIWSAVMGILVLLVVADFSLTLWRRGSFYFVAKIEPDLVARLKKDATDYVLHHSASYLSDQQSGKLADKALQISSQTERMFWALSYGFYWPAIGIFITLFMLAMISWWFALLFVFWMTILTIILLISSVRTKRYSKVNAENRAVVTGKMVDAINNSLLVKSFARFKGEQDLLRPFLDAERQSSITMIQKIEWSKFWQIFVIGLFNITTLILAIYLWKEGQISAGNIVLVLLLTSDVMQVFTHFVHELLDWYKITGVLENALQIVSHPHDIKDVSGAMKLNIKRGEIVFKSVAFEYMSGRPVFKDFSLKIKAGERVGLVGISGSGKSSFINLLQRFYDINSGSILIDGQDISKVTQDSLHQNIAVIPQDTSLFHRTLSENIGYGNPLADKKKIVAASKRAYAHSFIMQTQHGYDSLVGDRGVKLSGGQRQRIAIARAILKNAPILILDEATSALDSESEKYIQDSMKKLMRGKTVIAVAHRLSTLKEMDRIIVMNKGRIIEQGTPEQLLKKKGKYAKLWRMQTQQKESAS